MNKWINEGLQARQYNYEEDNKGKHDGKWETKDLEQEGLCRSC